ncbi:hypothetical protein LCGC14_1294690 [marine sediment metagenome]|uniref:Uncharacterized protein n=1 Tax=marine sediment metagenome TaxID=412755 RepID=A0A0F9KT58_9ZZZZ
MFEELEVPVKEKKISLPKINIEHKENVGQYFGLLLTGTPHLRFSITDKKGKEIYSNLLNVEMR